MADLIDRDALIDSLGIEDWDIYCKHIIEDAPSVDALRKQSSSEKPNNWISVEDRLPKPGEDALLYFATNEPSGCTAVGFCWAEQNGYNWASCVEPDCNISCDASPTHWMTLPEPPKGVTK